MLHGVMITHGPGGHPSWKHAAVTAEKVVVDPLPGAPDWARKVEAATLLRHKLKAELEKHHEDVRQHELKQLSLLQAARLDHPLEPESAHVEAALATIVKLTEGTILEAHFDRQDVQEAIRHELRVEFRTQQYIHRNEHRQALAAKKGA